MNQFEKAFRSVPDAIERLEKRSILFSMAWNIWGVVLTFLGVWKLWELLGLIQ